MNRATDYGALLQQNRADVLRALGIKFDTMAALGRVAEDDQAQLSHDEFISLRMNSLEYEKLRLLNEALLRLERGEYGICAGCDGPIAEKRLHALPWAKYCVRCQERAVDSEREDSPRMLDPVGSY